MDWIVGIQKAIDYIETHLDEDLNYEKLPRKAFLQAIIFKESLAFFAVIPSENIFACADYRSPAQNLPAVKTKSLT